MQTQAVSIRQSTRKKIHLPLEDRVFYTIINILTAVITISIIFPLMHIVAASFSDPAAVSAGKVVIWPVGFSLEGYQAVFSNKSILTGYANTIFYTVAGTVVNVAMTAMAAYALSRKNVPFMNSIMFMFTFTMMFGAGMVPNFIIMGKYHLLNTRLVMIIPGAIGVQNLIITRTFFRNIPEELLEAARIDGCSDIKYFFSILLPLSKAVLAVITLYYAVGHWNAYFDAFLYLNDRKLYPLQIFLQEILLASNVVDPDPDAAEEMRKLFNLLKYCLIVVSSVPILCFYPFIQKYFVKGVMIGSIKG